MIFYVIGCFGFSDERLGFMAWLAFLVFLYGVLVDDISSTVGP
jgi:hypothetical protein